MIKGTIVFIKSNVGSKSEGTFPYLVKDNGEKVKIRLVDVNPFENNELAVYENKQVVAEGEYNEYGTFMATSISCKDGQIEKETKPIVLPEIPNEISLDSATLDESAVKTAPIEKDDAWDTDICAEPVANTATKEETEKDEFFETLCQIFEQEKAEKEKKMDCTKKKEEKKTISLFEKFKMLFTHKKH